MKVAVIGSRNITNINIGEYLPKNVSEIITGGARGVDTLGEEYAKSHGISVKVFYPEYNKFKRGAPLKRNIQIIEYADEVIAFWDGVSKGTYFVINECKKRGKKLTVITCDCQATHNGQK